MTQKGNCHLHIVKWLICHPQGMAHAPLTRPPFFWLYCVSTTNMLTTNLKSMGDRGYSYWRSFCYLEWCPMSLLININCYSSTRKERPKDIHIGEKPFISSACTKKGHLTLSYAFSKLILKINLLHFFQCNSCTVSYKMTTPSRCCIHARKLFELLMLSTTELIPVIATLVKNLLIAFSRQIRLHF